MRCHPTFHNIPIKEVDLHMLDLMILLKDNGYKLSDIAIFNQRKIKKMCEWEPGSNPRNKQRWTNLVNIAWDKASAAIFPSEYVPATPSAQAQEILAGAEQREEEQQIQKSNPVDRSLITVVIENTYDEEAIALLGIPEDFRE